MDFPPWLLRTGPGPAQPLPGLTGITWPGTFQGRGSPGSSGTPAGAQAMVRDPPSLPFGVTRGCPWRCPQSCPRPCSLPGDLPQLVAGAIPAGLDPSPAPSSWNWGVQPRPCPGDRAALSPWPRAGHLSPAHLGGPRCAQRRQSREAPLGSSTLPPTEGSQNGTRERGGTPGVRGNTGNEGGSQSEGEHRQRGGNTGNEGVSRE